MNKKRKLFRNPPIKLVEEGKWLLAVISFEATNSVFKITDESNSFSITTSSHWNSESAEKRFDELTKLIDLRSENDIKLHVEQVRKKGIFFKLQTLLYPFLVLLKMKYLKI